MLADALERLGFTVTRLRYGEIENLFARLGTGGRRISASPATPTWCRSARRLAARPVRRRGARRRAVRPRRLRHEGRHRRLRRRRRRSTSPPAPPRGSISLLITGDEEGRAVDGTVRVLEWMAAHDQIPDFCLVGEPTCPVRLGDMIKIGRRGSLNAKITVHGTQGHVAYPHRADNPVHRLVRALAALTAAPLDAGTEWFEPSTLQVTSDRRRQPGDQRDPRRGARRC